MGQSKTNPKTMDFFFLEEASGKEQTYPPLDEWAGRVVTLVVGTGALLLLHQLPIGIVVAGPAQLQVLLLDRVRRHLLDGQPVQRLLPGTTEQEDRITQKTLKIHLATGDEYVTLSIIRSALTPRSLGSRNEYAYRSISIFQEIRAPLKRAISTLFQ